MATMDPGQRGFGRQRQFNIPDLPFGTPTPGNVPYFDRIKRLLPGGQIPPELLEMLMAQFFGGQGRQGGRPAGGYPMAGPGMPTGPAPFAPIGGIVDRRAQGVGRPPMGGGRPPMGGGRPPMGGGRPPMGRPPMGGPQRGGQRPPMGGGRPPVIKIEDLVRALSGGGGQRQAPQANMPVPQARR